MVDYYDDDLPHRFSRLTRPVKGVPTVRITGKRSYDDSVSSNSSDAPFFSSDDLAEASIANYSTPKRKKHYQRSWFEPEDPSKVYSHRAMQSVTKVPKDSGVYINSESSASNSSIEEGFNVSSVQATSLNQRDKKISLFNKPSLKAVPKRSPTETQNNCASEKIRDKIVCARIIQECLDFSIDTIDMSYQSLATIPDSEIRRLKQLIREPQAADICPTTEELYSELTAKLKIYLFSNSIRTVPPALMELENLTVLSLRDNEISHIPQSIGWLWELYELNVAGNELRWLPWEFLRIVGSPKGKICNFWARPNPFLAAGTIAIPDGFSFRPFSQNTEGAKKNIKKYRRTLKDIREENRNGTYDGFLLYLQWAIQINKELHDRLGDPNTLRDAWPRKSFITVPIFLGMSRIAYFDRYGRVADSSPTPPSMLPPQQAILPPVANVEDAVMPQVVAGLQGQERCPTLFELALRSCVRSPSFRNIDQILPEHVPDLVTRGVEWGKKAAEDYKQCSVCWKTYVMPRAEWIEYWHCAPGRPEDLHCSIETIALPFLRSVCSWGCAHPVAIQSRTPWVSDIDRASYRVLPV